MVINKSRNLKDHILELNRKCEVINREISAIGAKHQVGKEEIRVKLKLYETYLMPALLYGLEAWEKIDKDEMNEYEQIQMEKTGERKNRTVSRRKNKTGNGK